MGSKAVTVTSIPITIVENTITNQIYSWLHRDFGLDRGDSKLDITLADDKHGMVIADIKFGGIPIQLAGPRNHPIGEFANAIYEHMKRKYSGNIESACFEHEAKQRMIEINTPKPSEYFDNII